MKCEIRTLVSKIVDDVDDKDENESSDEGEVQIVGNKDTGPVEVGSPAVAPSGSSSDASAKVKSLFDSFHRPTASELSRK